MPVIDDAWEQWLTVNHGRGCSAESMIAAMMQAGFDHETAAEAVHRGGTGSRRLGAGETAAATTRPSGYQYARCEVARGNQIQAGDRTVKVAMRCDRPPIVVFSDVLSDAECDEMIRRSRDRLRPSTTVNPTTGAEYIVADRSSQGIWFHREEDEFIGRLERRFAALMRCPLEHGEGLQVLRYGVGAEYRPHFDYFPPNQAGSSVHLARGGQRVATLIVYLSDVESGGETIFPKIGMAVAPRRGGAVYFRYLDDAGRLDPATLHGGAPVTAGEKWILTKWVRERVYG